MTVIYDVSTFAASSHKTMRTISLSAYTKAKYGLLLKVRYAAAKLVATEIVLGIRFAVLKYLRIK